MWAREERDLYAGRARELGAQARIVFTDAPLEVLQQRVAERNRNLPPGTFHISPNEMEEWSEMFEPPDPDELTGHPPNGSHRMA